MREAEMADIKKTFDEASDAAKGLSPTNLLTSIEKYGENALKTDPPVTPTTPEPPTPTTFVEAEAHCACAADSRARPRDFGICVRATCSGRQSVMSRRRHRSHQGPVDGPPDRAALAAHQGAAGVRGRFRVLLLLRQADLQCAGVAVRLGRRPGEFQVHLHRAAGILPHAVEARDVRRGLHLVPGDRGTDLHVRRARPLQARARRIPAVPDRYADLLRARLAAGLFPCAADADPLLAGHAAGPVAQRPRRSRCCPRSANICR